MAPETAFILDASVVLAAILGELTPSEAEPWLLGSSISAVNLSEVVAKLVERDFPPDLIAANLAAMKLDVRPFDAAQAERAGLLRASTHRAGLSLGDRACLSLATELARPAATTDKAWLRLDVGVTVKLVR